MSTKIKEAIPCGCCGHEIPRPSFFKRGYTITCPACKTKGWMRHMSRRSNILLLCMIFIPCLVTMVLGLSIDDFYPWMFLMTFLILSLPFLVLHQHYYEAEYMWPKDAGRKASSKGEDNQNNNEQ